MLKIILQDSIFTIEKGNTFLDSQGVEYFINEEGIQDSVVFEENEVFFGIQNNIDTYWVYTNNEEKGKYLLIDFENNDHSTDIYNIVGYISQDHELVIEIKRYKEIFRDSENVVFTPNNFKTITESIKEPLTEINKLTFKDNFVMYLTKDIEKGEQEFIVSLYEYMRKVKVPPEYIEEQEKVLKNIKRKIAN